MSLLRSSGTGLRPIGGVAAGGDSETVRRVVEQLSERMDADTARHVARFAYVLGRVAGADRMVSAEGRRAIERMVTERAGLAEEQAILVVQIAKSQQALFGGTEDYLVTCGELAATASRDQKLALLDCCMALAAVDEEVSLPEDDVGPQIASELGLSHADFIAARSAYREQLAVLKAPPRP